MSKEFVDAISIGANIDADKAFKDSISQKVGDALELKRREYSKSFVGNKRVGPGYLRRRFDRRIDFHS